MAKLKLVSLIMSIILVIAFSGFVGCKTTTATTAAETTAAATTAAATTAAETTAAETTAAETTAAKGNMLKVELENAEGRSTIEVAIPEPAAIKAIKMAVGSIGNRTDASWTQGQYNGYLNIKEKYPQVQITFTDAIPFGDFASWLTLQKEAGVTWYYLDSAQTWQEALLDVAPTTVGQCVYNTNGTSYSEISALTDNVAAFERGQWETSLLCGIAAGMMTKTGVIGFVGGVDYPELIRKQVTWELGAKMVNPDIKSVWAYVGSWIDINKGYETTKALIDQKADVIMVHADDSGKGCMQAIVDSSKGDNKIYAVGFASDNLSLAPDNVITTAVNDHEEIMEYALWLYDAGITTASPKASYQFTIKEGWRGLTPFTNVPQNVIDTVAKYKQMIIDGTIVAPDLADPKLLGNLNPADYNLPSVEVTP
jgi:basic membrane protein A